MIIPDVNLLVYAHNVAAPEHERARTWWEGLIVREHPVGLPWAVVFGFIRLITHPSVLADPIPAVRSVEITRGWMARPGVRVVEPGPRHLTIVEDLFRATGVAGKLTTDTHLAAIAIEHQGELCSNDHDFRRFPGLRWTNPLS